jgi:hypothetical protein
MAKEFRCKPSSLLGLEADPYAAWCFDEACFMFGRQVENELATATQHAKNDQEHHFHRSAALRRVLSDGPERPQEAPRGMFRDPRELLKAIPQKAG